MHTVTEPRQSPSRHAGSPAKTLGLITFPRPRAAPPRPPRLWGRKSLDGSEEFGRRLYGTPASYLRWGRVNPSTVFSGKG